MRLRTFCCGALLAFASPVLALDARLLWERWPAERFVRVEASCLEPAELVERLQELVRLHPELALTAVGRSVENRPIHLLTLGSGERPVLLWSQMHGDEPSATPALLDLASYLLAHRDDPDVARILDRLTLLLVPMLNPDGAETYRRRNAQGIDINRDALNLATPEGQLLKRLRDEHRPVLGFNLHDQNRRRTVGDTGVLATQSVLAVVGDAAKSVTPGRLLAQRAAVAIAQTLELFIPGGVGRFDDTYSPRAFGDNLTAWGTPVVLIESGGVAPGQSLAELSRLNFVALAVVLSELAADGLVDYDPARYDAIPENNVDVWTDVALRGGRILQPGIAAPFRADLAFDRPLGDRERAGCADPGLPRSEITELGDARIFGAGLEIDARGAILIPPFTVGVDGWRARRWLQGAALDRLARLGVARLVWVVKPREVGAALAHARALRAPGRPRVEIESERSALPPLVLARPAEAATAATLGAAVAVLERSAAATPASPFAARLERLWSGSSSALRFEGPASFLRIESSGGGEALAAAPMSAVYLDGLELRNEPR